MFLTALDIGNESYMNKDAVLSADFKRYLTDSLKERLAFDIANRTADFRNYNIGISLFTYIVDKRLNFICDVRNYLNCLTKVVAVALLFKNI